jgi:predicted outer membrane protein
MMVAIAVAALPVGATAQAREASDDNDRAVHAFLSAVDLGEVQTSRLATERATNAEVRTFAQSMIADHSSALHTREMLMQTENSGLVQRMAHVEGAEGVRPHSNPAAGGIAGAGQAAAGPAATGGGTATSQVPVGPNANSNPAAASTVAGQASASTDGHGAAHAGHGNTQGSGQAQGGAQGQGNMQGGAHAGHGNMQGGGQAQGGGNMQGGAHTAHALPPGVTPEMVQQLEAMLAAHPMSRPVMEANMRNMQVLQGVTGPQFDKSYMDAQIGAHRYALQNIDRMLAQTGALGDDIRGTLQQMRTAVASHLQMAEQIRARLM